MDSPRSAVVNPAADVQHDSLSAAMMWVAAISAAGGIAARVFAARGDLWLDEIWTLNVLAQGVHSVADIFTNFKDSNNHHLTSLWMWLVGPEVWEPIYRLPSVVASIGTIALSGLIARRRGRLAACIAITLTACSYLLIHFGTEARGYGKVIFLALLAWYALLCIEERRSWLWLGLFWAAIVFGFLAHLEFVVCALGLGARSLWRLIHGRENWKQSLLDLSRLFVAPTILSLLVYLIAFRGMEVAGGPEYDLWSVLIKTASYTMGGPGEGRGAWIMAVLAVIAMCAALFLMIWQGDDRWLFYAAVIATPLIVLMIKRPEQLYVRYFMVSVAFALVLLAPALATLLRRGWLGFGLGIILLTLFVVGNSLNASKLLRYGRGQYRAALRFMDEQSRDEQLLVTSDHDFRNATLVDYYKRYLERPDRVSYVDGAALEKEYVATSGWPRGPEWLIVHRFDLREEPDRLDDIYGSRYELVCIYKYSDLSGWHWLLYHNLNRPTVQRADPLLR